MITLKHDQLVFAFPEVSPKLRAKTLQQARLFGSDAEVLLWRDGDGAWMARAAISQAAPHLRLHSRGPGTSVGGLDAP